MNPDVIKALSRARRVLADTAATINPLKPPSYAGDLAKKALSAVALAEKETAALKAALAPFADPATAHKMAASIQAAVDAGEAHKALEAVMNHVKIAKQALDAVSKLTQQMAGYG
jgi:hypothetical protein